MLYRNQEAGVMIGRMLFAIGLVLASIIALIYAAPAIARKTGAPDPGVKTMPVKGGAAETVRKGSGQPSQKNAPGSDGGVLNEETSKSGSVDPASPGADDSLENNDTPLPETGDGSVPQEGLPPKSGDETDISGGKSGGDGARKQGVGSAPDAEQAPPRKTAPETSSRKGFSDRDMPDTTVPGQDLPGQEFPGNSTGGSKRGSGANAPDQNGGGDGKNQNRDDGEDRPDNSAPPSLKDVDDRDSVKA